jgi:hypothetical protein
VREVVVGFFSFTEVPADADRAYDEWHRLDHLPEQFAIDGVAYGQRWVATPRCAAARLVDDAMLGRARHLTLYLMTEPVEATLAEFAALAVDLRHEGRWFDRRDAVAFGAWSVEDRRAASRVRVRAEVVPWRPSNGVYVVVEDDVAGTPDLDALVAVDGVAGAWSFRVDPSLQNPSWRRPSHRVTVLWLDGDPVEVAAELVPVLAPGRAGIVHAGPYEPAPAAQDGAGAGLSAAVR